MQTLQKLCFSLLFALLAATQTSAGEITSYYFEIKANGFRYGEFVVRLDEERDRYKVDVTAQAKGIFGFMLRAKYSGSTTGIIGTDQSRQGQDFNARSSRIFSNRSQRVTFENGRPKTVSILPVKRRTALSAPETVMGTVNDPLTFLANMVSNLHANCPATADLYDGRRRTAISFGDSTIEQDKLICTGTYEIVEGPDHSLQKGVRKFGIVAIYNRTSNGKLNLNKVNFTSGENVISLLRFINW